MSYDPKPTISITELHEGIKAGLKTMFPSATVDYYGRPGEKIQTPAILFELDSIEPDGEDAGTDQQPVTFRLNAYCIRKFGEKDNNKLLVRQMTANLIKGLKGQRWGKIGLRAARFTGASPDFFESDPKEYEVMRVEFEHDALLGDDVWIDEGEPIEIVETNEQGEGYKQIIPVA